MASWVVVVVVLVAGCLKSNDVLCDQGRVCPEDYVCSTTGCLSPEEVAACKDHVDGDDCTLPTLGMGMCVEGGCSVAICGNGIMELDELCDDGNTTPADGCGPDCRSHETCGNGIIDLFVDEECDDGNNRSRDGCSSNCLVERLAWTELGTGMMPPKRAAGQMVFDITRARLVLFGGFVPGSYVGDTWESDGRSWVDVVPAAEPTPRTSGALAYDSKRSVTVLFGGYTGFARSDTWEYDGSTWIEKHPTASPPGRREHSAVYDSARKRIVLFGGAGQAQFDRFNDTWTYDGTTWTELHPTTAPPGRLSAAMAYDPKRDVIVMYGGGDANGFSIADTWEFDGTNWRQPTLSGTAPPPLTAATLAYDPNRQHVVMFGGQNANIGGVAQDDTWEYDGASWTKLTLTTKPEKRSSQQMAYDPVTGHVVVFGGFDNGTYYNNAWELGATTWTLRVEVSPPQRPESAAVYDERRGVVITLGDQASDDKTWELVGREWIARTIVGPTQRDRFAMAYDVARSRVVLFGGSLFAGGIGADTWEYDGTAWLQRTPTASPPARFDHAMTYDTVRKRVVLFGGSGTSGDRLDDTWEYDGTTWTQVATPTKPSARDQLGLTFDRTRSKVVLFGGYGPIPLDDTWEYDGTNWIDVSKPVRPPPRFAQIAYDVARKRVVVFSGTLARDTWEYDGTTWSESMITPVPLPRARNGAAMVYDIARGRIVMVGGQIFAVSLTTLETWTLGYTDVTPVEACFAGFDLDHDGQTGCADDQCWGACSPQCPPTTPPTACTAPRCGDSICDLVETCYSCPADCAPNTRACPLVCGDGYCQTGETATTCPGDCN